MLEKTIEQTMRLEGFSNKKKRCDDYFVTVPQNEKMMKICQNVYEKNGSKSTKKKDKCQRITKSEFCKKLAQNGWNAKWTKKELQKSVGAKNPKLLEAKNKIRKNMGRITEQQINSCFPNYLLRN